MNLDIKEGRLVGVVALSLGVQDGRAPAQIGRAEIVHVELAVDEGRASREVDSIMLPAAPLPFEELEHGEDAICC